MWSYSSRRITCIHSLDPTYRHESYDNLVSDFLEIQKRSLPGDKGPKPWWLLQEILARSSVETKFKYTLGVDLLHLWVRFVKAKIMFPTHRVSILINNPLHSYMLIVKATLLPYRLQKRDASASREGGGNFFSGRAFHWRRAWGSMTDSRSSTSQAWGTESYGPYVVPSPGTVPTRYSQHIYSWICMPNALLKHTFVITERPRFSDRSPPCRERNGILLKDDGNPIWLREHKSREYRRANQRKRNVEYVS